MCKEWFRRFQSDDFSMDNNSRKSPKKFENTELDALLDETIGNHHWGSLLTATNSFEASSARKKAEMEKSPRQVDFADNARLHVTQPRST